jgi:catechol-2,3-dioxygenase
MYAPWAAYGDLGASGRVAHGIALNIWQGAGVPPRTPDIAGLRSFAIRFQSPNLLSDAVLRMSNAEHSDGHYVACDPDGNVIVMG